MKKIGLGVLYGFVYNPSPKKELFKYFYVIKYIFVQKFNSSVQTTDLILAKFEPNIYFVFKNTHEKLFGKVLRINPYF